MTTIYKYTIDVTDRAKIVTHIGCRPVKVRMVDGEICIWCVVDTTQKMYAKTFFVYGTGHELNLNHDYIDTAFDDRGFVWHVYHIADLKEE